MLQLITTSHFSYSVFKLFYIFYIFIWYVYCLFHKKVDESAAIYDLGLDLATPGSVFGISGLGLGADGLSTSPQAVYMIQCI